MEPSIIVYTEYVNNSLLESLLFSVSMEVRTSRKGNVWEFMIDNCLYNLTIDEADAETVKEDMGANEITSDGPFYAITMTSMVHEAENQKQLMQLVELIENVLPVCGVVK